MGKYNEDLIISYLGEIKNLLKVIADKDNLLTSGTVIPEKIFPGSPYEERREYIVKEVKFSGSHYYYTVEGNGWQTIDHRRALALIEGDGVEREI